MFVTLFGRLDPLAASRRSKPRELDICAEIKGCIAVFEGELNEAEITVHFDFAKPHRLLFRREDIYSIFTNLIDNSIHWIKEKKSTKKEIHIQIELEGDRVRHIDYRDSGPGIADSLIEDDLIFDPEFSTKEGGTGLGLAIAGEAATRNGLELIAIRSEHGAYFRLQLKEDERSL